MSKGLAASARIETRGAAPMHAVSPALHERVARVAAVAAEHADAVDREGRFPVEAVNAMREERLLGAWIPETLGGLGVSLEQITSACTVLGQSCASAGMVFAMHQIQIASLVRHEGTASYIAAYLRSAALGQRLIASGTSEVGVGGDVRSSRCAVVKTGSVCTLEKQAPVISYGLQADDVLVTARRNEDASPSDQVLMLLQRGEFTLDKTSTWDAMGFRGTCSHGFVLRGSAPAGAVLPHPFADIAAQTMVPVSHLVWSALWLGMATDAVRRARTSARDEAKRQPAGASAIASPRLAKVVAMLHEMRAVVHCAASDYSKHMDNRDALSTMAHAIRINNLKLSASESLVEIVQQSMRVAGIAGYRLSSAVSLGRSLRDAFGALVMISNDRIIAANATLLLASRED